MTYALLSGLVTVAFLAGCVGFAVLFVTVAMRGLEWNDDRRERAFRNRAKMR